MFDRKIYFDYVRANLFGSMTQSQVDGQEAILSEWEANYSTLDLRWLSYPLATTYHETSKTMQPIEEYGKGSGQSYGKVDPETGQAYYGRGFVQLTWRDNYARADRELMLVGNESCEWYADNQLKVGIAAPTMFLGMIEGWFRKSKDGKVQNLERYFNAHVNDPYEAREIINGDKTKVPDWSNGVSIGNLIKGYNVTFLAALKAALESEPEVPTGVVVIRIQTGGQKVKIIVDDKEQ